MSQASSIHLLQVRLLHRYRLPLHRRHRCPLKLQQFSLLLQAKLQLLPLPTRIPVRLQQFREPFLKYKVQVPIHLLPPDQKVAAGIYPEMLPSWSDLRTQLQQLPQQLQRRLLQPKPRLRHRLIHPRHKHRLLRHQLRLPPPLLLRYRFQLRLRKHRRLLSR